MNPTDIINKILTFSELELKEFALKCEIAPDTLKKAMKRNKLSPDIIQKIHDKHDVRKEFLRTGKEPIFIENHTGDVKNKQPAISKEDRLIATLERAVDSLGRQNEELIQIVKELTGKVPVSNSSQ